jgi:uncharacterized protein (DUF697 family)
LIEGILILIYSMAAQVTPAERPVFIKEEEHVPTREDQAHKVIMQNVVWAVGGGALPMPLIDMIAITVVNVKMLKELSAVYEVPFREDQVKSILSALVAGLGAPMIGMAATVSLVKAIPFLGVVSALLTVPSLSAAFTYAVGKIFVQHFASGGTFLDFDPKKVREHFARQFEEGKLVSTKIKPEAAAPKAG